MSEYTTRIYEIHLILGDPDAPQPWFWSEWRNIATDLSPLIAQAHGRAAVRSGQFIGDGSRTVSFGRIGWNEKGHMKWTHQSPVTESASGDWKFYDMEMWAPSWTVCDREDCPPDVFFGVHNEAFLSAHPAFNPTILLATAEDLPKDTRAIADAASSRLAERHQAKLHVARSRRWAIACGNSGYHSAIGDMLTYGLFTPGSRHASEPSLEILSELWFPW